MQKNEHQLKEEQIKKEQEEKKKFEEELERIKQELEKKNLASTEMFPSKYIPLAVQGCATFLNNVMRENLNTMIDQNLAIGQRYQTNYMECLRLKAEEYAKKGDKKNAEFCNKLLKTVKEDKLGMYLTFLDSFKDEPAIKDILTPDETVKDIIKLFGYDGKLTKEESGLLGKLFLGQDMIKKFAPFEGAEDFNFETILALLKRKTRPKNYTGAIKGLFDKLSGVTGEKEVGRYNPNLAYQPMHTQLRY